MQPLQLSHFQAASLFALFTSVVFSVTSKNTLRDRAIYFAWCFAAFLGILVGLAWLMHFAHG